MIYAHNLLNIQEMFLRREDLNQQLCDTALIDLAPLFKEMYSHTGRPSIAPEQLLRVLLLQILYSVRSERMLVEQLDYNLLFRRHVHGRHRLFATACSRGAALCRRNGPCADVVSTQTGPLIPADRLPFWTIF